MSVHSFISNSSAKKSKQGTSKQIRGFNFRNNINIKKYNGKYNSISSNNDNKKK